MKRWRLGEGENDRFDPQREERGELNGADPSGGGGGPQKVGEDDGKEWGRKVRSLDGGER